MPGQDWTTTEAIAEVKDIGRIPDDDPDATNAKILAEMNRQMDTVFVPLVRKARADYYLTHLDYTITQGQDNYRIPPRATSSTVRTVVWVTTAGVEIELPPVPLTDRHLYKPQQGFPCVYGVRDDELILMPTPNSSALGTLRIVYERRPSKLVETTSARAVQSVDTTDPANVLLSEDTLLFVAQDVIDVVSSKSPFSLLVQDAVVSNVVSSTFLVYTPGSADRTPAIGDYVCYATETVIPQIPAELHSLLYLATAARLLRPIDPDTAGVLAADLVAGLEEARALLTPRQQGRSMKVKSTSSVMRVSGRRRGTFGDWHS